MYLAPMRWLDENGEVVRTQSFTCGCGCGFAPDRTFVDGEPMPFDIVLNCPACGKYVATVNPSKKLQPGELRQNIFARLWRALTG